MFFPAENPHTLHQLPHFFVSMHRFAFQVCCPGSFGNPVPVSPLTNPTLTTPALPPLHPGNGEALLPPTCETGRFKRDVLPNGGFIPTDPEMAVFANPVQLQEDFSWMAVLGYICK